MSTLVCSISIILIENHARIFLLILVINEILQLHLLRKLLETSDLLNVRCLVGHKSGQLEILYLAWGKYVS